VRTPDTDTVAQPSAPGLRAWQIQRRNRRRRVAWRGLVYSCLCGSLITFLPDRFNPLVHIGALAFVERGPATDYDPAPVAAIVAARVAAQQAANRASPALSDAPPSDIPPPEFAAADMACLAKAVYFEARGESIEGQIAVAQVVMNRVKAETNTTICQVVYRGHERGEKCQFSFACHAHKTPPETSHLWQQAQWIAEEVTTGRAWLRELKLAKHYHTVQVQPVWRLGLRPARRIGQHIFYVPLGAQPDLSLAVKIKYRWDEIGEYTMVGGPDAREAHLEVAAAQADFAIKPAALAIKRAAPNQPIAVKAAGTFTIPATER
jgi:spore germination cell wall hydrolase CwlJ-like protein